MINQEVCYKEEECSLIWNYGNGKCEILFFGEVLLVDEKDLVNKKECTAPCNYSKQQ